MVSEVLAEFPEMWSQNFKVLLTHTNLLPTILKHCGITADMKRDIFTILHGLIVSLESKEYYITTCVGWYYWRVTVGREID